MLACLRAGQHDGRCRQADDDFGGWVKTTVLFLAVSGPKFMKFWDDVGVHRFPNVFIMSLARSIGRLSCD